jgi:hypothetical protein
VIVKACTIEQRERPLPKRTVIAPGNPRPSAGELLSVKLGIDEELQWTWCHHAERGSSVIGYTIVSDEPTPIPEGRPIGFFDLEEKKP